MSSKRKSKSKAPQEQPPDRPTKKARKSKPAEAERLSEWPEYFHSLFKVYKASMSLSSVSHQKRTSLQALNTVLAFVTSRKQLATSFHTIRSSVENITKEPLDLNEVAELKALLPDIIRFSYVPSSSIRVNGPATSNEPDFSDRSERLKRAMSSMDEDEHVLTLEFAETWESTKTEQTSAAPTRTPAATKKLVERRNERYVRAVEELLSATSPPDNPVILLQTAAREHIPVHPEVKTNPSSSTMFEDLTNTTIPDPEHRPSVDEVLDEMTKQTWYKDQIIERRSIEARAAKSGRWSDSRPTKAELELSPGIQGALRESRGITSLYSHQVSAVEALSHGRHVIVSTSTASGKTVVYQASKHSSQTQLSDLFDAGAPIEVSGGKPIVHCDFCLPDKGENFSALAQDQKASLERLLNACPGLEHVQVATYDGDTPTEQRRGIRETASVVFTNFDMIHASILPHEELWRRFLKNLKLFVVDELHYYSGTMGSATIANPKVHMENIFGIPPDEVEAITEDGAPAGAKEFVIWGSPYVDEIDTAMGKIRKVCELVMKTLRTELSAEGRHDILERVHAYRGGYSPEDRRKIEHDAFTGQLLGIVATNALELGVDIGVLDAVLMLGFPMTLASFKQQAGRAGRRRKDSLVIFVAQSLPVDRYYVENPGELFDGQTDDLVIDLHSEEILESHLQCAAHEMPISLQDEHYFGPGMKEICEVKLVKDNENWYHTNPKFLPSPSQLISIRGAREDKYVLVDTTHSAQKILEDIEISRALFEVYEGGVVKDIKHDSKLVSLVQADVNWTTTPRDFTDVNALQTYRIREIHGSPHRAFYGKIGIHCQVFGFYKMRGSVILDVVDLENDPWEQETTGLWIDVPDHVLPLLRDKAIKPAAAIHSAAHAFLNQFALSQDLRTECKAEEKEYLKKESQRKRPA
ncbi:ATP-dependent 3'-5' DNA helicase, partial [Marasmius crinis-equi]